MGKVGTGTTTEDKLGKLSCANFITWGQSVKGKACTSSCDAVSKQSIKSLAAQTAATDCPAPGAKHSSEVKSALIAERESSQIISSKSLPALTLMVGAAIGVVGIVSIGAVIKYRANNAAANAGPNG